jgi:hypothetical protein
MTSDDVDAIFLRVVAAVGCENDDEEKGTEVRRKPETGEMDESNKEVPVTVRGATKRVSNLMICGTKDNNERGLLMHLAATHQASN